MYMAVYRLELENKNVDLVNHALSNLTLPVVCPLEAVRVCLIVSHSLHNLFPRGDDKRSVLNNRLIKRQTSDQEKPRLLLGTFLDRSLDAVTLLLENNVVILLDRSRLATGGEDSGTVQ